MEGVGSRLGRASSRYGPAATVFNGPVRKWKKKWVHVSSSSTLSYQSNAHNNGSPRLLLCRWTPLPPTTTTTSSSSSAAPDASADLGSGSGAQLDEPPRRKFRYTPIAVLEEQKKIAEKKVEDEEKTNEMDQSISGPTTMSDEMHEKPNINDDDLKEETEVTEKNESQDSNISNLDLGLGVKSPDDNLDADGEANEAQMKKASSSGFWSVG